MVKSQLVSYNTFHYSNILGAFEGIEDIFMSKKQQSKIRLQFYIFIWHTIKHIHQWLSQQLQAILQHLKIMAHR